ncbi:MAG TPA: retropepsin-like aspartic protease, partial [Coriobacteriia bacterium]|nr:retropepsin-like aspartic protease [Coriobacteriia bacterium]
MRRCEVRARRQGTQLAHLPGGRGQDYQRRGGQEEGEFLGGPAERAKQPRAATVACNNLSVPNGRPPDIPPSPPPPLASHTHTHHEPTTNPTAPPSPAPDVDGAHTPPPDPPPKHGPAPRRTPGPSRGPYRTAEPLRAPNYSTFALNSASQGEYGADETSAGVILLEAIADSHPAVALWDTGAEGDFASYHWVKRHGLTMQDSEQRVKYADGSVRKALGEIVLPVKLLTRGRGYECKVRVVVAELQSRFDLVLGMPFCRAHVPRPDWKRMTIELPERRSNGSIAWNAALRAKTTRPPPPGPGDTGDTGPSLYEVSLHQMERWHEAGLLDDDSLHCLNIRFPVELNSVAPGGDAQKAEAARCE